MKLFAVLLMLAGSMVAQTKQNSEAVANPKPARLNLGIDLQLGMSRDAIIPQLSERYKVDKIQRSGDEWIVEEKQDLRLTVRARCLFKSARSSAIGTPVPTC